MLNIVGNGMGGRLDVEHNVRDMDPKKTAQMAQRYLQDVVGIKIAQYKGPEWIAVERAVEAGTLANFLVMVDFADFRPERPSQQLVGEKLRPGDIYTHLRMTHASGVGSAGVSSLTIKQERFAQKYVEDSNASEAYRTAYDTDDMIPGAIRVKACLLLSRPTISSIMCAIGWGSCSFNCTPKQRSPALIVHCVIIGPRVIDAKELAAKVKVLPLGQKARVACSGFKDRHHSVGRHNRVVLAHACANAVLSSSARTV